MTMTPSALPAGLPPVLVPPVLVRGGGLAAASMAHLARAQGLCVLSETVKRSPVPVLMLSDTALGMIRGCFARPALFAEKHRITRRIVRWGAEPVDMPHGAVVVSEQDLIEAFGEALEQGAAPASPPPDALFATVHASPPFPSGDLLRFGQRRAMAAPVVLAAGVDRMAVQVEAVARGWLFLIPSGEATAWLLGVGGPLERLLEDSRLVAPCVAGLGETSPAFETAPRQLPCLAGEDWLACGMSAIAYDPICGDGTAQAVREGVLGAAVLGAMARGGDRKALATHYHSMLTASLRRHIQISGQFYASGGDTPWWREQVAALREGYDWTTQQLASLPEPRYALRGFDLEPRETAA